MVHGFLCEFLLGADTGRNGLVHGRWAKAAFVFFSGKERKELYGFLFERLLYAIRRLRRQAAFVIDSMFEALPGREGQR